ncbi:TetR/AcrR family transcriptional regulator [Rhodobacteraceae bacterium KMM 6894]|nr:TetR/AcrR family transcriptional regulator [Rhodobacteraceae bacterium KMM 6894]
MDATAALFRKSGFNAVSMIQIASAVGLSKPGLYHHWPSKEALLHTIVKLSGELLLAHLAQVEAFDGSHREKIHRFVATRLQTIAGHQDLFTVTWQERAIIGSVAFNDLTRLAEDYRHRVRSMIEQAKSAGAIRQDVDSHLMMLALDGMTGWAYFWYRPDGDYDVAEIADAFWDMLSTGVVPPGAT